MSEKAVPVRKDRRPRTDDSIGARIDPPHPVGRVETADDRPTGRAGFLQARGVHKTYRKGKHEVPVLKGVDLSLAQGEFVAIVGQSGSGKSTLLHLLGTLDRPDAGKGEIEFDGQRIDTLPKRRQDAIRNERFGMIFQFYHLLPEMTALENVLMPAMIGHGLFAWFTRRSQLRKRAEDLLDLVGLSHRLHHQPRELSGGEMQRTAIARALMSQPQVLLADEPTGNLDRETGREVMDLLLRLHRDQGLTILMVTHDENLARETNRIVKLASGKVQAA